MVQRAWRKKMFKVFSKFLTPCAMLYALCAFYEEQGCYLKFVI